MRIYELLKVPDASQGAVANGRSDVDVESIDFYTELSNAMYKVENELLKHEDEGRFMWEFDEWGNLECYFVVDEGMQDGAPDCKTHIWIVRYIGYMIKIIDVIN